MLHAETGKSRVRKADKKFCKKFQKKVLTASGRCDSISPLRVQQEATRSSGPWQINSNATLKIQRKLSLSEQKQYNGKTRSQAVLCPESNEREKDKSLIPAWKFLPGRNDSTAWKFLRSKNFQFSQSENFYSRVWSWLRMNAGGVLNTCKSNGVIIFEAISLLRVEMLMT